MIRYRILAPDVERSHQTTAKLLNAEKRELMRLIEEASDGWIDEAIERTRVFNKQQSYSEPPKPNWSKIKKVYMKLQSNKCAYCEQKLEGGPRGPIAHDVEHYRPKNKVVGWPTRKMLKRSSYAFISQDQLATGDACDGYYLLPYNILNYLTACKICNSTLKRNYFPIAAKRANNSDKHGYLKREKPYLLYPLGHLDDDPEKIITFEGFKPKARPGLNAEQQYRARITIAFFELDIREPLIKQRAAVIKNIFEAFHDQLIHPDPARRRQARKDLKRWQLPSSEHANCARAFYDLCQRNLNAARQQYDDAVDFLDEHPDL